MQLSRESSIPRQNIPPTTSLSPSSTQAFAAYLRAERVTFVLGIHAYRSGRLLLGCAAYHTLTPPTPPPHDPHPTPPLPTRCGVPFGLILGGTDMNEHWQKVERRTLMEAALTEASVIVAFHAEQSAMLLNSLPRLQEKTRLIPQVEE